MRIPFRNLLLPAVCALAVAAAAQQPVRATPRFEAAVTYDASGANLTTGNSFWMQGGSASFAAGITHGFSAVADFSGLHSSNIGGSQLPLSLVTVVFGPRYRWRAPSKTHDLSLFGQALVGEAHGFDSTFPATGAAKASASSVAFELGGGIDLGLKHHIVLRLIQANWLRTSLPNATTNVQNNLLLDAGVVFRF
jgi:opacity protein-like surface antigen